MNENEKFLEELKQMRRENIEDMILFVGDFFQVDQIAFQITCFECSETSPNISRLIFMQLNESNYRKN